MICIKGGEGVAGLGYWFSWFKKILGSSISEKNDGTVAGISLISHTNFNLPLSELGSCDWRIHHYRGNAPREKWVIQLQSKEPRREPDYQDRPRGARLGTNDAARWKWPSEMFFHCQSAPTCGQGHYSGGREEDQSVGSKPHSFVLLSLCNWDKKKNISEIVIWAFAIEIKILICCICQI